MGRASRINKQRRQEKDELGVCLGELPIWVCPCGCGSFALFPFDCNAEMASEIIAGGNQAITELGVCMTQVWDILEKSARDVVEQSETCRDEPFPVYSAVNW